MNETETRQQLIDIQLSQAGWSHQQRTLLDKEVSFPSPNLRENRQPYEAGDMFVDYLLYDSEGKPLALVEAKRTSRDPLEGQEQARQYAERIKEKHGVEPFIFLANGHEIWFWDRSLYPPRLIGDFLTPTTLKRLAFQRQYRLPLATQPINQEIIPNREYQSQAVRRVTEAMSNGRRHFLLVMATGTGKTRTVIALIDLLFKAKWIQRVLFLADRRALVNQAVRGFKEHIPDEPLTRLTGGAADHDARIHVTTYPSMMQIYKQLPIGYYDLIVADESHRSIYNHYKALLDYFDAQQIGLTATPTDYIDHNTFELFECDDGLPTFYYPYDKAVQQNYLVDYKVHHALTHFQIEGIQGGNLPLAWQKAIEEQGIDLSEINFSGTDLERRVTNRGTTDAIVREFMDNCRRDAQGTLPAKTIIFAMSHYHAMEILKSFQRLYPSLQRRGLAQVIDSHMERVDKLLDDFKRRDMPRIAISVDMLDTGIDVPTIENLVFAKPVFSQVKFWQMIGRGTRLWHDPETGYTKESFLILDFWSNFHYFNMNPEPDAPNVAQPLPVRLFRLRLERWQQLRAYDKQAEATAVRQQLQTMLSELPSDNVNVRPHLEILVNLSQAGAWTNINEEQMEMLNQTIAPLVRFAPHTPLNTLSFAIKTEQLALAVLQGDSGQQQKQRQRIEEELALLPQKHTQVAEQQEMLLWVQSDGFWDHLTYERVMQLQEIFAPLMRYRQKRQKEMVVLNLPDHIANRWVMYGPAGEGALKETYRQQVEAHVHQLAERHPTLRKLKAGEPIDEADEVALAQTLDQADLFITTDTLRETYDQPDADLFDFIRHILRLATLKSREEEIQEAFEHFFAEHPLLTATQLSFLRMMRSVIIKKKELTTEALRQRPFTRLANVDKLFQPDQLDEIWHFAQQFIGD